LPLALSPPTRSTQHCICFASDCRAFDPNKGGPSISTQLLSPSSKLLSPSSNSTNPRIERSNFTRACFAYSIRLSIPHTQPPNHETYMTTITTLATNHPPYHPSRPTHYPPTHRECIEYHRLGALTSCQLQLGALWASCQLTLGIVQRSGHVLLVSTH
jgi:hypothetical protein